MKIAVLADIHGNMAYLERAQKLIEAKGLKVVIVCGDVQDEESLEELDNWGKKIYLVLGNADYYIREKIEAGMLRTKNIEISLNFGNLTLDGTKIAYCHYPNLARKLAESGQFDVVFYGHNHRPWEEKVGKTILLNPGEIQARDGKPTFAIFDTKTLNAELKILV